MAMGSNAASAYITQWLESATKGKVVAQFAVLVPDRVQFHCLECGLKLTANIHDSNTIDYGVQEFVRLHAHNGEYEKTHVTPGGTEGKPVTVAGFKPTGMAGPHVIPLTADFKPVSIPDGPTNVAGKTDLKHVPEKPKDAPLIIPTGRKFK